MTEKETWKIIYVLKASYINQFKGYTTADFENHVKVWQMMFKDYTYEQVSAGLKIFLASDTKGFIPSPGQVMDCILKITMPESEQLSESEAWSMVRKAISKGIYHAKEEYEKFPEIVKRAVGSFEYLEALAKAKDFNEGVESSNFSRKYNTAINRQREEAKIPKDVKQLIATTVMQLEQKGQKE